MGPILETESEELFHSTTHGLVVWAVAVTATATMVVLSGLVITSSAVNAGALFGAAQTQGEPDGSQATGYWVDMLFRPASGNANAAGAPASSGGARPDTDARAESDRILTMGLAQAERLSAEDRNELVRLVSQSTGASPAEAGQRTDAVLARMHQQEVDVAEAARRVAKVVSLWLAASLIFGGLVAAAAAVSGRWVDDTARGIPH
jgi:hypothetical protein